MSFQIQIRATCALRVACSSVLEVNILAAKRDGQQQKPPCLLVSYACDQNHFSAHWSVMYRRVLLSAEVPMKKLN